MENLLFLGVQILKQIRVINSKDACVVGYFSGPKIVNACILSFNRFIHHFITQCACCHTILSPWFKYFH